MAPFIRPLLGVGQTTLSSPVTGQRFTFRGLYTLAPLRRGDFLGFYNGMFHDLPEAGYNGKDAYVMSASNEYIKPKKGRGGRVDPAKYPMAMINESPPARPANVTIHEFTSARGVIPQLPPKTAITALGFYACRDIAAGEELFVNYGKEYKRDHYENPRNLQPISLVGKACKLLKKNRQRPVDMAAEWGLTWVDEECFVVLE